MQLLKEGYHLRIGKLSFTNKGQNAIPTNLDEINCLQSNCPNAEILADTMR
jgi:hypothetical protein